MVRFLLAFVLLLYAITNSAAVTVCVEDSLLLWYHSILPILFPGMLCSGFMLPYLKKLVNLNSNSKWLPCLILLPGFLCGFPLGTYLVTNLFKYQLVSREEANNYIGFSNNISPLFMLSIVLKDYPYVQKLFLFLLFYSVPLTYGIITLWRNKRQKIHALISVPLSEKYLYSNSQKKNNAKNNSNSQETNNAKNNTNLENNAKAKNNTNSEGYMMSAIENILRIAGYIILFRLIIQMLGDNFAIILSVFKISQGYIWTMSKDIMNGILEISSGVISMKAHLPESLYWKVAFPLLTFGGFCTCLQTKALLPEELSFSGYIKHKLHQTAWMTILCLLPGIH